MRRRGWSRRPGSNGNELLERMSELRGTALRDLSPLEGPTPPEVRLASGRFEGDRPVAVVLASRPGDDLVGWAWVALHQAAESLQEVVLAAPFHSARTQRLASRASRLGVTIHLLSVPALSEGSEDVIARRSFPDGLRGQGADGELSVYQKVLRVMEGAAALTSIGGLRSTDDGAALYLRGELAAQVRREGEGVSVAMLLPDRRRMVINDSNFPRWGVELHEMIVQLARDPRLLEGPDGDRLQGVVDAAAAADATITARWLPCSPDGRGRLDWVGVDRGGRAVLGIVGPRIGLAEAAQLVTALLLLEDQRAEWAPGSQGAARLSITSPQIDVEARVLLEALEQRASAEVGAAPAAPSVHIAIIAPVTRSPRSRSREAPGRRSERAEAGERREASEQRDPDPPVEAEDAQGRERRGRRRPRRRRRGPRGDEATAAADSEQDAGAEADLEADVDVEAETDREAPDLGPDAEPTAARSADRPREPADADSESSGEEALPAAEEPVQAAEEDAEPEEAEDAPEEIPEPPRRRRQRATVVVRDDPPTILAALVLARDRRVTSSFRVVRQEGLMDYFKGPANDVPENEDLLMVGFTAQPHVREVLDTAELFRGRLQWFDHHPWPIEDLERLRKAVGRESILIEAAASSLHAINQVTERRSRFTDKLVDLSARRLSDADMEKWGYRVIALTQRMALEPGEHRPDIGPVLSGKAGELPAAEDVYSAEAAWVEEHDPRMVHFGEYELAVAEVPDSLDPGEVGRKLRMRTGARLSLAARHGDDTVVLTASDEKRPLNVMGLAEAVDAEIRWAHAEPGGDRVGRMRVEDRAAHPERMDAVIGAIVRQRSVLYG